MPLLEEALVEVGKITQSILHAPHARDVLKARFISSMLVQCCSLTVTGIQFSFGLEFFKFKFLGLLLVTISENS